MLLEQGSPLTLGHPAPYAEFDPVVQGISAALGDHRTVPTDDGSLALRCPTDEQLIRVGRAAQSLRDPRDAGLTVGPLKGFAE